jgi:hypothetical protein
MDYAFSLQEEHDVWATELDAQIRDGLTSRDELGDYRCSVCGADATAVAVGPNPSNHTNEYVQGPHFRAHHETGCEIVGEETLTTKSGTIRLARTTRPPGLSYPGKLVAPPQREAHTDVSTSSPDSSSRSQSRETSKNTPTSSPRASRVSTLQPIANHFLRYRRVGFAEQTLQLRGRSSHETAIKMPYADAFQYLRPGPYLTRAPQRILYGSLMYTRQPDFQEDYAAIPVFAGPKHGKSFPENPHRLRVQWGDWSDQRKEIFESRYQDYRTAQDQQENAIVYVFCFAQPDLANETDFVVDSHHGFCIAVGQRLSQGRRKNSRN